MLYGPVMNRSPMRSPPTVTTGAPWIAGAVDEQAPSAARPAAAVAAPVPPMLVPGISVVKPVSTCCRRRHTAAMIRPWAERSVRNRWMIETPRLRLRPPCPADASALSALMTPAVSRWLASWPVPFTAAMATARIAASLDAITAGQALVCAVEHQGAFVGWLRGSAKSRSDLRGRIDGTDRGEFGYWLGEPWHGRGFMQEAAPPYLAALRVRLALNSIEATCQAANARSARVLAASGLRRVGTRLLFSSARGREEPVDVWERAWTRDPEG